VILDRRTRTALVGAVIFVVGVQGRALAQVSPPPAEAHVPTFENMLQLREIDEIAVSPDGRSVAYTTRASFRADTTPVLGRITLLDLQRGTKRLVNVTGQPRRLRWSPTGSMLAFLAPSHGRPRIWVTEAQDTAATPRLFHAHDTIVGDVLAFTWSPSGDAVAYVAANPASPESPGNVVEAPPRLVLFRDAPGEITGPTASYYQRDTIGAYLAVASVRPRGSGTSRLLARKLIASKRPPTVDWSRTGTLLVSGTPIGASWGVELATNALYGIDARTGAVLQSRPDSRAIAPAWSPSGRWIAYLDAQYLPQGPALWTFTLRVIHPDHETAAPTVSPETDGLYGSFPPVWGRDDRTLYIARYQRGTARLYAVDLVSGQWRALTPDTLSVSRYAVTPDGKIMLAVLDNANQAQEIYRIHPSTGNLTQLTHEADALPFMQLGRVDQVYWPSIDGRFAVHGFLVKPPAYNPARRYPLLVFVHGGPSAPFTNSFLDVNFHPYMLPAQLLAADGYLVLLPNPRGDTSYGPAFRAALHGDWGPGPFRDIDAGVSTLIARGLVDSTAVGIYGTSYGGYLTAFAITQTNRFAAASIDDGPVNLESWYSQNYATMAPILRHTFDGTPWTRPEAYASQSPIRYIDRVRTPVLMRYGGRSDTRDNIRQSYMLAQGFEFYAGLRDHDVPVEFVLHPDQGHGIADWRLYQDWVRRNLRWFGYWVQREGVAPNLNAERDPR
jgi:dipeptidyl aminopeptidase/acylaminoacyl peptidase